jgi:hypothetical protein
VKNRALASGPLRQSTLASVFRTSFVVLFDVIE